ncbi:unnamed protein product [Urochloa decumbens]|uniref:F-box domain-containing protein n=1 Tax=Urochloa decumbens TaxID=240449 RepID=A0ABC9EDM8_9POAL
MEGCIIPEDLIINDILMRLPVKSLLRFRSVCKAWCSEISSRHFKELHGQRSQPNIYRLSGFRKGSGFMKIERLTEEGSLQQYCMLPWLEDLGLVISSHHLIVVSFKYGYLLSNPVMRDSIYVPSPSWGEPEGHPVGFGFVSSLGKYKMVGIILDPKDTCEVFTVGIDRSWRKGIAPPRSLIISDHMPYINGNLHMLSEDLVNEDEAVLVFNLEDESWSVMALPDVPDIVEMSCELREMQGFLCYSCCICLERIDIWMLRDYTNNVWSKDLVIDGNPGVSNKRWSVDGFPLEVLADGRIFVGTDYEWFYYDPRDGSIQKADCKGSNLFTTVYSENLVPVLGF